MVTLTPQPAWYQPLDVSYSSMKYRYGQVDDARSRIYVSLEDAVEQSPNYGTLASAPYYVAITGQAIRDGNTYYDTLSGWMSAQDVQLVTPSVFRGILISRTIGFRFGWVLTSAQSINAAGQPVATYSRYQVVQEVPSVLEKPGYLSIGPDEWLPLNVLALTNPQVPADVSQGTCRFIYVDLAQQTLRVYDHCSLVFATLVSTGRVPGWTFPGRFTILYKVAFTQLTPPPGSISIYYLQGVPDFMTYSGNLGLHGAYWHDEFGSPVSHGCVNMSPADAKWLYTWAREGDPVIIGSSQ
jgi:lipoprotein-anchoring transpeptidase ErfK/SrfK